VSLAGRIAGGRALQEYQPGQNWLADALVGDQASFTGKHVTVQSALQLDTVVACVRLLSETMGGFPINVYEGTRDAPGPKRVVAQHPTHRLLHDRPNPTMPPVVYHSLAYAHLVTWGEAFHGKVFGPTGVEELWAVEPSRVRIELRNKQKLYWVKDARGVEGKTPYTDREIIHVIGFTLDGVRGLSPIGLAREAIGAGLSIDEYTNRFFKNGALPHGVLETDHELSGPAYKRLRADWEKQHRGARNAHRDAILEQGLKYHAISMPLTDIEFVALNQLSAKKICRFYRVPSSMVDAEGEQSKGLTYRNTESDNQRLLQHTLAPWLARYLQSFMHDNDLFPPGKALYADAVVDSLLALDAETESRVFSNSLAGSPWQTPNEVRAKKHLPPLAGGDVLPEAKAPAPTHAAQRNGNGNGDVDLSRLVGERR
jgi:HK97 family phage portal protein